MHIGLIGGIGPAATVFYYQLLVSAFARLNRRLNLTIVQADVHQLVKNVNSGKSADQAHEYCRLTNHLKAAGADFVVITSLGGHFCIDEFLPVSPLPVLNAIPVITNYLRITEISSVGILGTRVVMQTQLYGALRSQHVFLPEGSDMDTAHDLYQSLGISGQISKAGRQTLFALGQNQIDRGAEMILLAGTDLYVAFENQNCGYPVLDCAEVHVEAIVQAVARGELPH